MQTGPMMNRCATCGQEWWDAHCCPKQKPPMTLAGFFDEAKRLKLRMLGTPEETRSALDLKDAEIARLRAALTLAANRMDVLALDHEYGTARRNIADDWAKETRAALGPNV